MNRRQAALIGLVVFFSLTGLTQFLAFQQYTIVRTSEHEATLQEASLIRDKLNILLTHSLSATSTLAYLVENYGEPDDFNAFGRKIIEQHNSIDAVELTRGGVITHVYPLEGNEVVIGYDVLADPATRSEALKALDRRELYFAGPVPLKQGGEGAVGRLPIFRNDSFWGFAVVVIRLNTLLDAAGIKNEATSDFSYQLAKRDPVSGKKKFLLDSEIPEGKEYVSIDVPDGGWDLYVSPKNQTSYLGKVLPFAFLGLILSGTGGLFAWHLAIQPTRLKKKVKEARDEIKSFQQKSTANLEHLNRLLQFTSSVNHMTIHATDESQLYEQACQIAGEIGGFKLAWIGSINEEKGVVEVACKGGDDQGYLNGLSPIPVSTNGAEGPLQKMLRIQDFILFNDIAEDPLMKPWAENALARGFRSSILLPVKRFGKITNSLHLYSDELNPFDDEEIRLLLQMASNISFALDKLEGRRLRHIAEERIRNEKLLSDSIINSMPGIFYLYDREGKFVRWNKNFETVSGYTTGEVSNMHPLDFFSGKHREVLKDKINNVFDSGYDDVIAPFASKDGHTIPYHFNGRKIVFDGVDYLIGMGLDISARVKAEEALMERTEEIQTLTAHLQNIREEERSQIALEIHDVLGQQLTALKMDAAWLKKKSTENKTAPERIETMLKLIDDTIKTVRRIASDLRPGILEDMGLVAALEWQGTEFQKNTGLTLDFTGDNCAQEPDKKLSINVFRVYQETLTNIARHAEAKHVDTRFHCDADRLQLIVKDDGKGINLKNVGVQKSLGLIGMRERARLFGGEVSIANNTPHGTVITLDIPLNSKKNHHEYIDRG